MRANKRVRDLSRRSYDRLVYLKDSVLHGVTTYPTKENKVMRVEKTK